MSIVDAGIAAVLFSFAIAIVIWALSGFPNLGFLWGLFVTVCSVILIIVVIIVIAIVIIAVLS